MALQPEGQPLHGVKIYIRRLPYLLTLVYQLHINAYICLQHQGQQFRILTLHLWPVFSFLNCSFYVLLSNSYYSI